MTKTRNALPRKRLITIEAIQKRFHLDKPRPYDSAALGINVSLGDMARGDANMIYDLFRAAQCDGLNETYGPDPVTSDDFADDAAIDCEHIEMLLRLPERSVLAYYLLEYHLAYKLAAKQASEFYVDEDRGNDTNTGKSFTSPLQSAAELKRRISPEGLLGDTQLPPL